MGFVQKKEDSFLSDMGFLGKARDWAPSPVHRVTPERRRGWARRPWRVQSLSETTEKQSR